MIDTRRLAELKKARNSLGFCWFSINCVVHRNFGNNEKPQEFLAFLSPATLRRRLAELKKARISLGFVVFYQLHCAPQLRKQ